MSELKQNGSHADSNAASQKGHTEVSAYYDRIAGQYDEDRFGNTYGQFIDRQERTILRPLLSSTQRPVLDLGCGTGRLLGLADTGLDASAAMLQMARAQHPDKSLFQGNALKTPFENEQFGAVFSFHVVMHLQPEDLPLLLLEMQRILRPGGQFVFDFPSKARRKALGYQAKGWHGANAFDLSEIRDLAGENWRLQYACGILFLPIHRIPVRLRVLFFYLDQLLCRSFLKKYSSYLVVSLTKK